MKQKSKRVSITLAPGGDVDMWLKKQVNTSKRLRQLIQAEVDAEREGYTLDGTPLDGQQSQASDTTNWYSLTGPFKGPSFNMNTERND